MDPRPPWVNLCLTRNTRKREKRLAMFTAELPPHCASATTTITSSATFCATSGFCQGAVSWLALGQAAKLPSITALLAELSVILSLTATAQSWTARKKPQSLCEWAAVLDTISAHSALADRLLRNLGLRQADRSEERRVGKECRSRGW